MQAITEENKPYKNFQVFKSEKLPEINADLIEIMHMPTGAVIYHLKNDDPENVFCIGLQTFPSDSTGVAHILEHIALCGSKKYPLKDPFFSMTRRSLNTFMNAFTGSDFTLYPASSMVEKDFYNLLDVYLDAVFFPELKKISFLQEGHRLEIDQKGKLQFKGVVFNEMKGAMSSSDQRLWVELFKHLMPDLTYSHNSGGDPKEIVQLSYEELKEFHKTHYHPSIAQFYFYGNLPIEKHLDFLEDKALSHFTKIEPLTPIPLQKRFDAPVFIKSRFPSTEQKDGVYTLGYLTTKITDYEEVLALTILDSLLMDTDASLLKKPILESKLCKEVSSYLDTEVTEVPWALVFKGVEEKNREKLHDLVFDTLKEIAKKPLPEDEIQAAMHQIEFMRSEIVGDRMPYGLILYMRAFLAKPHGAAPENNLLIHSLFKSLEEKFKDPSYLTNLIEKYFIKNTHVVDLFMLPDPKMQEEELKEEQKTLEKIHKELTQEKIEELKRQAAELKNYQESQDTENIGALPIVDLSDIPKECIDYPLQIKEQGLFTTYYSECFTNNILYLKLIFPLPKIKTEDLFALSLFSSFLTEVGTKSRSYEEILKEVQAYTGGLYSNISLDTSIENPDQVIPTLRIHIKGFYRNTEKLFSLLKETALSCDFSDKNRLKQLLLQLYISLENSLAESSMRYAKYLAQAPLSQIGTINENLYGLSFFLNLKKLVENFDSEIDSLIEKFEGFKEIFFQKNFDLLVSCSKEQFTILEKNHFYTIQDLGQKTLEKWDNSIKPLAISSSLFIASTPVTFTSLALDSIGYTHQYSAALLVAAELMENTYLHEEIREKGGAYGSGANYQSYCKNFTFYGYRDPHLKETLDHFKKSVSKTLEGKFSDQELFEAKLGIFQAIDSPLPPKSQGSTAYHWYKVGKTKEIRQKYRDMIFAVDKKSVQEALEKHLLPAFETGIFSSFGSKELLEREGKRLEPPVEVKDIYSLSS